MLVTVSGPMAVLGRSSSILGRFAARLNRSAVEIRSAGARAPPRYSPAAVSTENALSVLALCGQQREADEAAVVDVQCVDDGREQHTPTASVRHLRRGFREPFHSW